MTFFNPFCGYNPLLAWNSSAFACFRVNHVRVISDAAEDLVAALQPRGIDGSNVVEVLGRICPRDLRNGAAAYEMEMFMGYHGKI